MMELNAVEPEGYVPVAPETEILEEGQRGARDGDGTDAIPLIDGVVQLLCGSQGADEPKLPP